MIKGSSGSYYLIAHMNGRIYDPTLGRFLQADPHIQAPTNSQNYNRYSYVLNNPLSYTDPSGYFFKALGKFVKKHWKTIVAAVATYYTFGFASGLIGETLLGSQILAGAAAGSISGFVGGAIATGSLRGALQGAFSGAVFGGIGAAGWGDTATLGAHAFAGGIISDLQGGNFGHGFLTAGVMKGFGKLDFGKMQMSMRTVVQAMVGGTVSKLTGGKFGNGAVTAAIQFVVNEASSMKELAQDAYQAGVKFRNFVKASPLGIAMSHILEGTGDSPQWRYLYRVVGERELAQIQASGQFSVNPDSGWPEKQFWTNIDDAEWYANSDFTQKHEMSNSLSILETRVSQETFSQGVPFSDAGHSAVSFSIETLPSVNQDALRYGINLRETIPIKR